LNYGTIINPVDNRVFCNASANVRLKWDIVALGSPTANNNNQPGTFQHGQNVELTISNLSRQTLFVYVIDLRQDGSIKVLHLGELNQPKSFANEPLDPGRIWKGKLKASVSAGNAENRDVLKLFASTSSKINLKF
jgi:hypothetical protein